MRAVISASRRTDIPMHFPAWLADVVRAGVVDVPQPYTGRVRRVSLLPGDVHSLVLWSKDFRPVLGDEGGVRTALRRYDQVFCHFTVTGLGGTRLEPGIAPRQEVLSQLPDLIDFVGDPRRVSVRFDPIVHWLEGREVCSNLVWAEPILQAAMRAGIGTVRISFASLYGKVRKRKGWRWYEPTLEERLDVARSLARIAGSLGVGLYACSQRELEPAGVAPSKCIDGDLLSALHPKGIAADARKDTGQRPACGCTRSVDIGSYTMRCPSGCSYCYANPRIAA